MTLSFQTKWPARMGDLAGQPNHFVTKICEGIAPIICNRPDFDSWYDEVESNGINLNVDVPPKRHTIRADPHSRWKPGKKIHFVINNRTKNRFQFAPVISCTSIQTIEIHNDKSDSDNDYVKVDGKELWTSQIQKLAVNDGFPSFVEFFDYFNNDFTGKIIHWTDLKY